MRNAPIQETSVVDAVVQRISDLLPTTWRCSMERPLKADSGADAILTLSAPSGASVAFRVLTKYSGAGVGELVANLRWQTAPGARQVPVLLMANYLGPTLRARLADEGVSFADATGWVKISLDNPLIVLTSQGAVVAPREATSSAVTRLNGVAVSRLIRVLCAQEAPLGVRQLADYARVSPGSVSKILPTLVSEGAVERDQRGVVIAVRRRALLQRWVRDYAFTTTNNAVGYYIAPRGLERTLARLESLDAPVTVTGSGAARALLPRGSTPVVPLMTLALYGQNTAHIAESLDLIPASPDTANVIIAVPQDTAILEERLAPASLIVADLLTLPGRGDAEAVQLMDQLSKEDSAWGAHD